ncbi:uncharacterized protein LOC124540663 [Vanessa cardui]|uniref:uncharacterized protein LOC124540663 n=1 Tax=Vanessa cardui TaxID=171605 RepID=UPI001F12CBD0|nr:uncharacterized protein LOC124540663 [Vanessa cardui]
MNNSLDFIVKEEVYALKRIGEVAAKIAFYNFDWRYVTLVMFNTVQYTLALGTFLKIYKQSVIIKLGKNVPRNRIPVPQFVIFGQSSIEIIDTLLWLDKMNYDNSGKYIIVCTVSDYENCNENQIFSTLAKIKIINVIYMRGESTDDFVSFSYDIVHPGKCVSSEPYNVDVSDNCPADECYKTVFPDKLKNFNKCSLIVSTFEQPPFMYLSNDTLEPSGGDGNILKLVANALNATLEIKLPQDGNDWGQYDDGNWTGSLGDVFNDRVHASMCSLPVTADKYGNFQISFVYNSMDIVWTAKLPLQKPAWQKLLNPLQTDLRIVLFFTFVCIVFINSLMKLSKWQRLRKILKIGPTRFSLLFYSWALFLGIPILRNPSIRQFLLVMYCWIWFSFVIRNAYQAALIGSLKKHDYEEYFTSFEDVLKGKYPYGGLGNLRDYYADDSCIYDNWETMEFDQAYEVLDKISEGKSDIVLAFNKEIIVEHLIDYNGVRHLQILPEKIVNSPTVIFFKKNSVLTQPVSRILSILVEAGFSQLIHARYLRHKKLLFQLGTSHENVPLTLENFNACMVLMVFGWFLSIIFFVAEAYCGRLQDDEKQPDQKD